jgi:heparan-alpha-glucosaminide N-acetyltransferase
MSVATSIEKTAAVPARVLSIDAYRGFVMFLMMAEVMRLYDMGKKLPESKVWQFISFHTSHVDWGGCSLHDLIQPSFSFLVGVALPFSLASRFAKGQTVGWMTFHAVWRALLLIFLGIFLRSIGKPQTYYTFEDTLTQIGLGYVPLFLIGLCHRKWHWISFGLIILGYWLAFVLYPVPADFDYAAVGVPADWPHHATGIAEHFNKNSNLAWSFDTWFLNLFPTEKTFTHNEGGYATLSFIPTLATMVLGLIAGGWMRNEGLPSRKTAWFVLMGLICLAIGLTADKLGLCPSVKRIWTPSWVLVSGGWCFLLLAAFHGVIDVLGFKAWSFPLRVIGANSIAAYVIAHPFEHFVVSAFHTHFGRGPFQVLGSEYEPVLTGAAVLLIYWLILFWMYRKKIYIKI